MDSPGPCQPRFKIFERLLFDDFWVDWIDIDFEYTKIWSKYIPTSRTVKVPKRVRFWQENVHFSAAIHSSAFLSIIAAIVWEVCIFMPRSYTFGNFDFNGKPKGFDHYPIPIFDRLWLEGCICYPTKCSKFRHRFGQSDRTFGNDGNFAIGWVFCIIKKLLKSLPKISDMLMKG